MLLRAQHTYTILSKSGLVSSREIRKSIGCVSLIIEYFFLMFPITRSTCIRTLAIFLVCSTSIPVSWDFPLVNAGVLMVEQREPTESLMSNPLSARIKSPGTRCERREQCSVRNLSLVLPPHSSEM